MRKIQKQLNDEVDVWKSNNVGNRRNALVSATY